MIKKILFLFFVVFAATAYSQDVTITGTVTDANSEPLVGVNVLVKGTTTGAITDIDGNFSVSGKKGSTLVFSYIGMLTQEVVYKGTALRVVMKDDSKALEEVVVIGYQTVKKSDLTGAVAVADTKEMKKSAAGTLVSQMQGLATGINVRSSGRAGEDASIEIRGVGSLSNNSPLWVIDGMITDPGVDFNPADAESIQILKDASAAAIYGSRAANGVIIVTTKKGTKGPMKVNVSVKETLEWSPKFDLMNAAEYIKYNDIAYNEAIKDGIATVNSTQKHSQYDTNWQDEVLKTALVQTTTYHSPVAVTPVVILYQPATITMTAFLMEILSTVITSVSIHKVKRAGSLLVKTWLIHSQTQTRTRPIPTMTFCV